MEAICSSETSVDFQLATRRCVPEDGTLYFLVTSNYTILVLLMLNLKINRSYISMGMLIDMFVDFVNSYE
jgi:hypothetical protein